MPVAHLPPNVGNTPYTSLYVETTGTPLPDSHFFSVSSETPTEPQSPLQVEVHERLKQSVFRIIEEHPDLFQRKGLEFASRLVDAEDSQSTDIKRFIAQLALFNTVPQLQSFERFERFNEQLRFVIQGIRESQKGLEPIFNAILNNQIKDFIGLFGDRLKESDLFSLTQYLYENPADDVDDWLQTYALSILYQGLAKPDDKIFLQYDNWGWFRILTFPTTRSHPGTIVLLSGPSEGAGAFYSIGPEGTQVLDPGSARVVYPEDVIGQEATDIFTVIVTDQETGNYTLIEQKFEGVRVPLSRQESDLNITIFEIEQPWYEQETNTYGFTWRAPDGRGEFRISSTGMPVYREFIQYIPIVSSYFLAEEFSCLVDAFNACAQEENEPYIAFDEFLGYLKEVSVNGAFSNQSEEEITDILNYLVGVGRMTPEQHSSFMAALFGKGELRGKTRDDLEEFVNGVWGGNEFIDHEGDTDRLLDPVYYYIDRDGILRRGTGSKDFPVPGPPGQRR